MGHNRWYFTGILLAFLLLCLAVLGMRWRVLAQRVPLEVGSTEVAGSTLTAATGEEAAGDAQSGPDGNAGDSEPMALTANLNPPADNAAAPIARESRESAPAGKIDINSASADELDELPGIGPKLAQAIVEHRKAHGAFSSIEALLDVPGIGEAKLEALRGLIVADSKR